MGFGSKWGLKVDQATQKLPNEQKYIHADGFYTMLIHSNIDSEMLVVIWQIIWNPKPTWKEQNTCYSYTPKIFSSPKVPSPKRRHILFATGHDAWRKKTVNIYVFPKNSLKSWCIAFLQSCKNISVSVVQVQNLLSLWVLRTFTPAELLKSELGTTKIPPAAQTTKYI